jgi:hypothetical protein
MFGMSGGSGIGMRTMPDFKPNPCPIGCTCREYCDDSRHSKPCPLDASVALAIDDLYNDDRRGGSRAQAAPRWVRSQNARRERS